MSTATASPAPGVLASARQGAAKVASRAYESAKAGAASALGVAGLASITTAAALQDARLGWAVGGVLAVWLASLLPAGDKPGSRR